MRIFSFIPVLAALVTAVVAAPTDNCGSSEMGCGGNGASKRDFLERPARSGDGSLTNAELLRRGLPPKDPFLRRGTPVRRHQPSSRPDHGGDHNGNNGNHNGDHDGDHNKNTHTGVIEVLDSDNNVLGYIAKNLVNGGAQAGYDPSLANALTVSFKSKGNSDKEVNIVATNFNPSWNFLGMIQGRDDSDSTMKSGSYQYGYLGGVGSPGTKRGDTPTLIDNSYFIGSPRTAETAVWVYDSNTGELTPHWVNPDGTTPNIQYWTQSTGLYFGGDEAAFVARYPAPAKLIKFKFVSS